MLRTCSDLAAVQPSVVGGGMLAHAQLLRLLLSARSVSDHEFLLHTRPMFSAAHASPALLSKLLTPMVGLTRSEPLLPTYQHLQVSLTRCPGMPTLKYTPMKDTVECTGILI